MSTIDGSEPCLEPLVSQFGSFEVVTDEIANLLDDLAGLGEHWARNRAKGLMPRGIRNAMVQTAQEIALRIEIETDITRRPVG